ncbi:hypothetical protein ABH909_003743 [Pseudomonas sp. BS3782 TE3695]|jgi:hypothetical protein
MAIVSSDSEYTGHYRIVNTYEYLPLAYEFLTQKG